MSKIKRALFWKLFHNVGNQSFYWEVYNATLYEMNYKCNGDINSSGEKEAMKYVITKLQKYYSNVHLTIFDVGANIGNYTKELLTLTQGKYNITVHCFEPSPTTFNALNKELGNIKEVITNNVGLSDHFNTRPLYSDKPGSGMTSLYNRRIDHFGIHLSNQGDAILTTIDQYCQDNNINHIHFIKIDVEGHEANVIEGGLKMLNNNNIDFIQFEFGGTDIDSRTFFQDFWYLLHKKYKIYRIIKKGLIEITEYNEQLEIFSCSNYLAELKL